jgi:methylthioribose-1-phosphate isomerase
MKTVEWSAGTLKLIDQTQLPMRHCVFECHTVADVGRAIRDLVVRGAPAIGVTAAYGLVLAAQNSSTENGEALLADVKRAADELRATRPTAINLAWALDRVWRAASSTNGDVASIRRRMLVEADIIAAEDEAMCRAIGAAGAELIADGSNVLTHCNAGGLATVSFGTALGVIRAAHEQGKRLHVFVDETRPVLQGARLTAWELAEEGIPLTLITDNMAGYFMSRGKIDLVVVGADRITANGDVANKIGTYSVAVLAKEHRIPFYVAAPTSTVDLACPTGDAIPIEERNKDEVLYVLGQRIAPEGVQAANPAFDVTPCRYITAIITEAGVIRPPFEQGLRAAVSAARVEAVDR